MSEAPCEHKGMRTARTTVGSEIRRMEWCDDCGELLDDRSTPTPLPGAREPLYWLHDLKRCVDSAVLMTPDLKQMTDAEKEKYKLPPGVDCEIGGFGIILPSRHK